MIRCQSCHEFVELQLDLFLPIAKIAHTYTCRVCGANDATSNTDIDGYGFPAIIARRSTDTGTFLAWKTVKGNTSEIESSGPRPNPVLFHPSMSIILNCIFFFFAQYLVWFTEIHMFFKVLLYIVSIPAAIYARIKADELNQLLNGRQRVKL